MFLALEAFAFFAQIHFLDLAILWPSGWLLQLFYTSFFSPPSQFSN